MTNSTDVQEFRIKVFRSAMTDCHDSKRLRALAASYEAFGMIHEAALLRERAMKFEKQRIMMGVIAFIVFAVCTLLLGWLIMKLTGLSYAVSCFLVVAGDYMTMRAVAIARQ